MRDLKPRSSLSRKLVRFKESEKEDDFYLVLYEIPPISPEDQWACSLLSVDGKYRLIPTANISEIEVVRWPKISLDWAIGHVVSGMLSKHSTSMGVTAIAGRTKLFEFQLKPLLKFFSIEDSRLLIADEVGLGKTIEACYILLESMNRGNVGRVVILCPSHLIGKWRWELYSKFGVGFSKGKLNNIIDLLKDPDEVDGLVVSIDAANSIKKQRELQKALAYGNEIDFLIIDEVHHCIGRGGETFRRNLAMSLSSVSTRVVALSASPVQLEPMDLKRIYDVLRPGILEDDDFKIMLNLVAPLNRAYRVLSMDVWDDDSISELESIIFELESFEELTEEVVTQLKGLNKISSAEEKYQVRRHIWLNNPISSFMVRTRKIEVGEERKRVICNLGVDLSKDSIGPIYRGDNEYIFSEKSLFERTEKLLKRCFSPVHIRQMSSSLRAVSGLIERGIDGINVWKRKGKFLMNPVYYSNGQPANSKSEIILLNDDDRQECREVSYLLQQIGLDSKWDALVRTLEGLRSENENRKVVVFTHWLPTLEYIQKKILKTSDFRSMKFHFLDAKSSNINERERKLAKFRFVEGFAVLFSSDILSEGIDLQEADTIINYDLLYNPQKLEQRIGRLDRIGQESQSINVYNLYVNESIDEDILNCLDTRINYFRETIGELGAIVEGNQTEWITIDETEIARINRQQEVGRDIEKSGMLTVLDDILDESIAQTIEEERKSASNLRLLPIVNAFKLFSSDNVRIMREDNRYTIAGINEDMVGALERAIGGSEGHLMKVNLMNYIQEENLSVSMMAGVNGWFPHLRGALMEFASDVNINLTNLKDNEHVLIKLPAGKIKQFASIDEIVLVEQVFESEGFIEREWEFWGESEGRWNLIDINMMEFYQAIKAQEDSNALIRVSTESLILSDDIGNAFEEWKGRCIRRYKISQRIQLAALARRLRGRLLFLRRRIDNEDDDETVIPMLIEYETVKEQLHSAELQMRTLNGADFARTSSSAKPYLRIVFD